MIIIIDCILLIFVNPFICNLFYNNIIQCYKVEYLKSPIELNNTDIAMAHATDAFALIFFAPSLSPDKLIRNVEPPRHRAIK